MLPRKPLAGRLEPALQKFGAGFGVAPGKGLCHPAPMVGAIPAPARIDQGGTASPLNLPGPARVGGLRAETMHRHGQRPADARHFGSLPFRVTVHAVNSGIVQPFVRGRSRCVSPFLFLPLRPLPLGAASRPTSSAPSLVPPSVRSSPMPRAARRWPVRLRAALPACSATTSTSAADPAAAGLTDSRLSFWPPMQARGWSFHLGSDAAGDRPCSRRS